MRIIFMTFLLSQLSCGSDTVQFHLKSTSQSPSELEVPMIWKKLNELSFLSLQVLSIDKKDQLKTKKWIISRDIHDLHKKIMGPPTYEKTDNIPQHYEHTSKLFMYLDAAISCKQSPEEDYTKEKLKIVMRHSIDDFVLDKQIRSDLINLNPKVEGLNIRSMMSLVDQLEKNYGRSMGRSTALSTSSALIQCNRLADIVKSFELINGVSCFSLYFKNSRNEKFLSDFRSCMIKEGLISASEPKVFGTITKGIDSFIMGSGLGDLIANNIKLATKNIYKLFDVSFKKISSKDFVVCNYQYNDSLNTFTQTSCAIKN